MASSSADGHGGPPNDRLGRPGRTPGCSRRTRLIWSRCRANALDTRTRVMPSRCAARSRQPPRRTRHGATIRWVAVSPSGVVTRDAAGCTRSTQVSGHLSPHGMTFTAGELPPASQSQHRPCLLHRDPVEQRPLRRAAPRSPGEAFAAFTSAGDLGLCRGQLPPGSQQWTPAAPPARAATTGCSARTEGSPCHPCH